MDEGLGISHLCIEVEIFSYNQLKIYTITSD